MSGIAGMDVSARAFIRDGMPVSPEGAAESPPCCGLCCQGFSAPSGLRWLREFLRNSGGPCWLVFLALVPVLGCGGAPANEREESLPPAEAGCRFDSSACGTIQGRVWWQGELPVVPPLAVLPCPIGLEALRERQPKDNPNAPAIDPEERGVRDTVVFLRGIDPARSRAWHHPPITAEMQDFRLLLRQGDRIVRHGFVRRGDSLTMVSRHKAPHILHADGAAFFTLPFPEPDQPLARRLDRPGVVELRSAIGYFWMRAYLFVGDHPYYTLTAADGTFTLTDVPAGTYEIIAWLPNWHLDGRDLDPESGIVLRQHFRPPVEVARPVRVEARKSSLVELTFTAELFSR